MWVIFLKQGNIAINYEFETEDKMRLKFCCAEIKQKFPPSDISLR